MPRRQPLRQPHLSRLRRRGAAVALGTALLSLPACGRSGPPPLAVPVPAASADVGAFCDLIAPSFPPKIDGTERRKTSPESKRTAAWGDPAVVLRCGVDRPKALTAMSQLNTVNGIDWFVEDRDGGHVFTTVGRAAYVEVTVPAGHDPQVGPLVDLAPAMTFLPPRPEFLQEQANRTATPKPGKTSKPKR